MVQAIRNLQQASQSAGESDLDKAILAAHQKARTDPRSIIPILEDRLAHFEGNLLCMPGKIDLRTKEGPDAVQECIDFL